MKNNDILNKALKMATEGLGTVQALQKNAENATLE
jgi:hypothetical protein